MAIPRGIRGKEPLLLMIVTFLLLGLNDIRCSADDYIPESADKQDISFFLNSREKGANVSEPFIVPHRYLDSWIFKHKIVSAWNPAHKVVILVHGWTHSANYHLFTTMAEALMDLPEPVNVARVNWEKGAAHQGLVGEEYFQSAANTAIVGEEIAKFIWYLLLKFPTMKPEQFHIIGHSLGAHAAGYAGAKFTRLDQTIIDHQGIGRQIARITGLDPANPFFKTEYISKRLDASDASFVDVIHTGMTGVIIFPESSAPGTRIVSGHIDFVPNGFGNQPGCNTKEFDCPKDPDLIGQKLATRRTSCNHRRAVEYYTESIRGVVFKGRVCDSWKNYTDKKCSHNQEIVMGYYAKPPTSKKNLIVYMSINIFSAYPLKDRKLPEEYSHHIWDINGDCCTDPDPDNGKFRTGRCQQHLIVGCGRDSICWRQREKNSSSWCYVRTTHNQPLKCVDAEQCLKENAKEKPCIDDEA